MLSNPRKPAANPFRNDNAAGAAVSGSAPQTLISGLNSFDARSNAGNKTAAADARQSLRRVSGASSRISKRHRSVSGNEIMIVKGMNKRPVDSWKRALFQSLPRALIRNRKELCA